MLIINIMKQHYHARRAQSTARVFLGSVFALDRGLDLRVMVLSFCLSCFFLFFSSFFLLFF